MNMMYGYARVSSTDQNEARQVVELLNVGVSQKNIYVDKQSGKDFNRPAYKKLVRRLREGDELYILSIDRLGRDYIEIQEQWRRLTRDKKVHIFVIDRPILDTNKAKDLMTLFISDISLGILSYVAQSERDSIKTRQMQGIEAAKDAGVIFGRKRIVLSSEDEQVIREYVEGELFMKEAMEKLPHISRSTIYRKAREQKEIQKKVKIESAMFTSCV